MNLGEYRKKAEHLSQPENFKEAVKENWTIPTVGLIFALALFIRYIPEKGMDYLQALDPYMIYRMSQHMALSGGLPALDFTRYFPYATPIHTMNLGDIAIPALMHRYLGFSAIFPNYMEFAQFYPAFMGAIGVVAMYFLGKELFDEFTGVSAAFFLAVLSGVMHRTSAGFFEKEPTGTALMLISMVFFTKAWKQRDWKNGIASGLAFGMFTISWGGSNMLWLLYPLVVGSVLFIDEDIRSLIAAYTPTVLVGGFFAAAFNPSRFWFSSKYFLANLGLLALLWSRYIVEEYELLEESQLKYYVPTASIFGGIMVALSPLYSQRLGRIAMSLWSSVTQSGGGVIGGTVAENQAANLSSLVSSLGVNAGAGMSTISNWANNTLGLGPVLDPLGVVLVPIANLISFIANFVNPWTLMLLGIPVLATPIIISLARKYDIVGEVSGKEYYSYIQAVTISWLVTATAFFLATPLQAPSLRFYSIIIGVASLAALFTMVYYLGEEAYNLLLIVFGFLVIGEIIAVLNVVGSQNLQVVAFALFRSSVAKGLLFPVTLAFVSLLVLYVTEDFRRPKIEKNWYYALPFFWAVTNLLGAGARSRLVFLSGFSVTLIAGFAFTKGYRKLRDLEIPDFDLENPEYLQDARLGLMVLLVGVAIVVNMASGVASAQQLGGSPSEAWDPALNYMEEETPEGSVIMSWWDYGYWFESIGRRAAVADGGNFGYYTSEEKINYPLADFLTSSNPENHTDFLEKHSVDYIALDRSMIGKYSAVSQISRRSNQNFSTMQTLTTPQPINAYLQQPEGQRVAQFTSQRTGLTAIAPLEIGGQQSNGTITNLSIDINEPITLRSGSQTLKINCLLTDEGRVTLGNTSERRTIPYCAAERPAPTFEQAARSQSGAGLVLVPEEISDSTLVRLYLMDGHGIDFVEKKDINRFEYVKMWEVNDDLQ